ncbi:enediyne biosynthesis protein UnbU [Phycicoccus sp. CSK15P-2]|uniref:enediyne biosynthesis protein UnbU n=1 Tax=Phycicoccus sp. CSK15P-2 TaxID=2807627 RepID=UPI0019501E64|nr:enediyne biosynthesis protein UnbU [Phycicoccus sp. CSK15P-2]MBM6405601.1 enediyne biosynthesis protein UnbU [Phycicoccus sp. CSK15P-2]
MSTALSPDAPPKIPTAEPTTARPVPAPARPEAKPPADPRYLALRNFAISVSVFNIFGYWLLGFEQPYLWPILAILTAYTTELTFESLSAWAQQREARFRGRGLRGLYEFLLPSHITAIAVNMLLYANNQLLPILFGVVAGVTAKHVLQAPINGRMRHYMNPSNFGITMALLAFGSWISVAPPYQFGENVNSFIRIGIPLIIATAGTVLNATLTKKVPLIVGWLGGFVIQAVVRHWVFDVALMSALSVMSGIAFILFTNYMISDPGTTPFKARAQFMFGSATAFVYGLLVVFNVVYTLFFAVTIVCLARGIGWWGYDLLSRRRARRVPVGEGVPA